MINLIFDIDGTLTDTTGLDDRFFLEAVAAVTGTPPVVDSWEVFSEVTDSALARALLARDGIRAMGEAGIMEVRRTFIARWKTAVANGEAPVVPVPGAREVFEEALARRDLCVAIATGGWGPTALLKLAAAGFAVDERIVASADDAEQRAVILRTASSLAAAVRGVPGFSGVIVIGDGVWDARDAHAVGAGFVGIAADPVRALRLRAEGAVAVVPDFADGPRFWAAVEAARVRLRASPSN